MVKNGLSMVSFYEKSKPRSLTFTLADTWYFSLPKIHKQVLRSWLPYYGPVRRTMIILLCGCAAYILYSFLLFPLLCHRSKTFDAHIQLKAYQ
jgi:hypothetical protein